MSAAKELRLLKNALSILTMDYKSFSLTEDSKRTKNIVSGRLSIVEDSFKQAKGISDKLIALLEDEEQILKCEATFEEIRGIYLQYKAELLDCLDKFAESTSGNKQPSNSLNLHGIRLPEMALPVFSGQYTEWRSFKSKFETMIHNNPSLTDIQKMHYLKSGLSGEADRLLQHLDIDEGNYYKAWSILCSRYENKRFLVNTHLKLFFGQSVLQNETAVGLKRLLDTSTECLHSLENLGLPVKQWDLIIIYILFQKLPSCTQQLWEERLGGSKELPRFDEFSVFLEARFRTLEVMEQQRPKCSQSLSRGTHQKAATTKTTMHVRQSKQKEREQYNCKVCGKGQHPIRTCNRFIKMNIAERSSTINKIGACNNCLAYSHTSQHCPSQARCYFCQQKHHSLLHGKIDIPHTNAHASQMVQQGQPSTGAVVQNHLAQHHSKSEILLATAMVRVKASDGRYFTLRALIDSGSQATFITEAAVQLLKLDIRRTSINVSGLGQVNSGACHRYADISFGSLNSTFETSARAYVFRSLTGLLPAYRLTLHKWDHISGLTLADPMYFQPATVDLLLGCDMYVELILPEIVRGDPTSPIAQNTHLGWILQGHVSTKPHTRIQSFLQQYDTDTQLRKFWEIEEVPFQVPDSEEDLRCEKHFNDTTRRLPDGRYEVSLPFKDGCKPALGASKLGALRRFHQLEKRLENNPTLQKEYSKCIEEYLKLGQMTEIDVNNDEVLQTPHHYFVPHHAVIKETSSTTKLRVVFDAAAKTSDGTSLNERLMVGPKKQTNIIDIILRWRTHQFTFTADIEKMYRQIRMKEQDAYYQVIFWRSDPNQPIKTYRLDTVTFGTASAPYLAIRTLNQVAADEQTRFQVGATAVLEEMYVDDLMSGSDSISEAIKKRDEVRQLLATAGFNLRKWTSNSQEILQGIPPEERALGFSLPFDSSEHIKALGIRWYPIDDSFTFQNVSSNSAEVPTKRTMLSTIARLFDPLGWISPCIVKAKIMMQQLWWRGLAWDEPVPSELNDEWELFCQELPIIEKIRIPRWIHLQKRRQVELHGFCDASEKAYGAVIYLRILDEDDNIQMHLLMSKTRVAPLKTVTLPRLELCGAVILATLLNYTAKVLNMENVRTYAWSDSTITLSWILAPPSKWKTFVGNRVAEIQRLTNCSIWRHVPTQENPADFASRGLLPTGLINNILWWNGPAFLRSDWEFTTPPQPSTIATEEESRKTSVHCTVAQDNIIDLLIHRHSNLQKLLRTIAYCFRFVTNVRKPATQREVATLTPLEIESALRLSIRIVQCNMFFDGSSNQNEIHAKVRGIKSLSPFLDDFLILRVGGRLQKADLSFDQRHPIILKPSHHFTSLIIRDAHDRTFHGGMQQMIAFLRQRFWILNMKNTVKKHIHSCAICFRHRIKPGHQMMGTLPEPRVRISRPFSYTGVDYAGPIEVKAWKGRGAKTFKAYFAIFVCLATKALHIELVSDMTTQAFIAAFRRFTARRGSCKEIFSDCGKNFVGANRELDNLRKAANYDTSRIADTFLCEGTKWNFIPPAAPHFGGLWEAGVKSVKYHLKRIAGNATLTFEELATLLTQIEGCLNSRPLCPLTSNPDDFTALTPAHFLIGEPFQSVPEPDHTVEKIPYNDRWKLIQRMYQTFWKQWSSEYLARLQQRPKWLTVEQQPQLGDLVLVKDERLPPSKWIMARVLRVHPGADQLIRVVTLKTQSGEFQRPITKICSLPSNKMTVDETLI